MLSLVRSQKACLERLRSAIRWGRGLVLLIGSHEIGKTTVVGELIANSPYMPLTLDGRILSNRRDTILRLVALVGIQPEESDFRMLDRLQAKQSLGVEKGVPEIIIDAAQELTLEVWQLFGELASGVYGRQWSILFVGEPILMQRALTVSRVCLLHSIVSVPAWDEYDLAQAMVLTDSAFQFDRRTRTLLDRFNDRPNKLLRSVVRSDDSSSNNINDIPQDHGSERHVLRSRIMIISAIGLALCLIVGLLVGHERDAGKRGLQVIPIQLNP